MPHHPKSLIKNASKFNLKDHDPSYTGGFTSQEDADPQMQDDLEKLIKLQEKLYAENKWTVLIILQAMDAAGKDGVIKHVMAGLNPQGCVVKSFKHPSEEEYEHDYLWRINKALPSKGQIGIFNRSYYENVLICKVHPELVLNERIPGINRVDQVNDKFWKSRYQQIRAYEKNLSENGVVILKFFLHLSKEEQKTRLLKRIDNPGKHWKFQFSDINERKYWKEYMSCYEEAIQSTSSSYAPWFVIPADNKWYTRAAIASIIRKEIQKLKPEFPETDPATKKKLTEARKALTGSQKLKL